MANTVIQLKFSEVTSAPATLNVAEPSPITLDANTIITNINGGLF